MELVTSGNTEVSNHGCKEPRFGKNSDVNFGLGLSLSPGLEVLLCQGMVSLEYDTTDSIA